MGGSRAKEKGKKKEKDEDEGDVEEEVSEEVEEARMAIAEFQRQTGASREKMRSLFEARPVKILNA